MIASNNKNNKLQRLGEKTLEHWCALRDLYLPKERDEILKRVEQHAYEETAGITGTTDREYFQLVLASRRLKYMKLARDNSEMVRALDDYHSWLERARKVGRPYIPVPEERPEHKEQELQQSGRRKRRLPIKKELMGKWMRMLDWYPRQDCKQVILDVIRLTNATMEYIGSSESEHPEFYNNTLKHWAGHVIEDWYEFTIDHYEQDPDPENDYRYHELSLEEITSLVLRDFRLEEYEGEDDGDSGSEDEEKEWAA